METWRRSVIYFLHHFILVYCVWWRFGSSLAWGLSESRRRPLVLQEIDLPGFLQPLKVWENELPFPRLSKSEK